jgi:hypothetical protein
MPIGHSLPFDRDLLITTPNSIHLRTPAGDKTVFECQSADGIVTACAAPDNSSLLAIADGHGVILHDTAHPRDKIHKLKGSSVSSDALECTRTTLTWNTGHSSSASVLARFTHIALQHRAQRLNPCVLTVKRQPIISVTFTSLTTERPGEVEQWQLPALCLIFATDRTDTRQTKSWRCRGELQTYGYVLSRYLCSVRGPH